MTKIHIEKEDPHLWVKKVFILSIILASAFWGLIAIIGQYKEAYADSHSATEGTLPSVQGNSLIAVSNPFAPIRTKKINTVVTAYSSTTWQTDDTPFITASGKWVEEGIIANNMLPFGTLVKIPELYGDKIFEVQDRMNKKKGIYHVDIWFPTYEEAKNFGAKITYIEVLGS